MCSRQALKARGFRFGSFFCKQGALEWVFSELCHTAVLQRQSLTDEKLKMQPSSSQSSCVFLPRYVLSCIYHKLPLMESLEIFSSCQDNKKTPQKRLENNGDITLVSLKPYGGLSHNPLSSLLHLGRSKLLCYQGP